MQEIAHTRRSYDVAGDHGTDIADESRLPGLWVCGASGVGKSSVGYEVFCLVRAEGVKCAYVDLDQIGFCRPPPDDDADNHRVKSENLSAMWANFRAAGARCLIVSGIVGTHEAVRLHADRLPDVELTVCRLRVGHEQLTDRIFRRGNAGGPPLPGDLMTGKSIEWLTDAAEDSNREADDMERLEIGDITVDTDDLTIGQVARMVLEKAGGWPGLPGHP